ncbi:MAG: glycosyltransferase family 4 protein, partial [Chloroflexi bacterium]|nr:glycosyltransferase family 4 protein [Chloroflexota bacterium]
MRILQVSPYDFAVPGGVNAHISHLERQLRRMGHEVYMMAPDTGTGDQQPENLLRITGAVVPVHYSGSVSRISLAPHVYLRVKAILHELHPDIVHVHNPTVPILPLAVLRHSKSVDVGTFHAYRDSFTLYQVAKPFLKPFMDKLEGQIAVSKAARDAVAHYFPGDYRIIPNGIDVERFDPKVVQPYPELMDGKLNILFVGRLEKRKGFRYLLHAFPLIKAAMPDARLLVAGAFSREARAPYVHYVRRQRLRDVKFIGYVSGEDLPRLYASCHVFCAPSTGYESFGIVLLEAMSMAKPVIATDITGYRSTLQHGVHGILVPPEDEHAL